MNLRHFLQNTPFLFFTLLVAGGCSPKIAPSPTENPVPAMTGHGEFTPGNCEPSVVTQMLSEISKAENERSALDLKAKNFPEKSNFKSLYEAELAYVSETESKIKKLTACDAGTTQLSELKSKVAKARASMTYLSETFPDFK